MVESSAPWNGSSVGDATLASYDAPNEWASYWRSLAGAGAVPTNLGGVFRGELNQLRVTAPGAVSPAVVDTGRALAYGEWYQNTATVNVAIPTPGGATRIDRIVLRKDWAAQTVRITRIAGVEGGGAPALVQIDGTTWDTPLAQASITTGAALTITDDRQFLGGASAITTIVKAADETVNNSAVLQDDDDFFLPVLPGDIVVVKQRLRVSGVFAGGGLKMAWTVPSGATYRMNVVSLLNGIGEGFAGGTVGVQTGTGTITTPGPFDYTWIDVETIIRAGDTAGTAHFQWAQSSAAMSDTKVLADSTLVATGISG